MRLFKLKMCNKATRIKETIIGKLLRPPIGQFCQEVWP